MGNTSDSNGSPGATTRQTLSTYGAADRIARKTVSAGARAIIARTIDMGPPKKNPATSYGAGFSSCPCGPYQVIITSQRRIAFACLMRSPPTFAAQNVVNAMPES